jgi:tetratricopeptide (TPR) repeat protein
VKTQCRIALVLATGLACSLAAPLSASAQESEVARAESFAAAAYEAYGRKDYTGAIALYKQALEAAPSADIVYNLARIYDNKLKDRRRAIEHYRRYTLDTGADPSRLRTASMRLAELEQLEEIATEASAPRREPVLVERTPPASDGAPPARTREDGLRGTQIGGLVTGAIGVAGIALGAGFGVSAKSDADVAKESCDGNACRTQRGVAAAEEASEAATISTVAFIAGGVLTALGVTLMIAGGDAEEEARETVRLALGPYASSSALGASLDGSF